MKKYKSLIMTAVIVAMIFALGACGKKSPTEQIESDMNDIKSEDMTDKLTAGLFADKELQEKYADKCEELFKKIQEFDYDVKEEKLDGDKAAVKVAIKTYDFGGAYKEFYNELIKEAKSGKLSNKKDLDSYIYSRIFKTLTDIKNKKYKKTVVVNLEKNEDGKWVSDIERNKEILDAIYGGMNSVGDNLKKSQ